MFSHLAFISQSYSKDEPPVLVGAYLGQKPPSSTPKYLRPASYLQKVGRLAGQEHTLLKPFNISENE